jgi:hypothetical protein
LLHCDLEGPYSWLANQDLHAASLQLLVEPWKDRCFTATVEGLFSQLVNQDLHAASLQLWTDSCFTAIWKDPTHGLRTKTCTLLHCDSWLNPGRIVASLRLWKDNWLYSWLANQDLHALHCDSWLNPGRIVVYCDPELYSRLVNQDLYAASLRLWKDSAHGV